MSQPIGSFMLVLHGHLPWVLRHGRWPHGETWLFEAAAETWLPLLDVVHHVLDRGGRCPINLGLTPVLLEQLSHERFKSGFVAWLQERRARAQADHAEFSGWGDEHLVWLAERWDKHFEKLEKRFLEIDRDIPGAFAALWKRGRIEILSSCATHGYLPLLRHDAASRAQVREGLKTSERILGKKPVGFWLPECAYRPGGPWHPPVLDGTRVARAGVEEILAAEGVKWFVVDSHLFRGGRSEGIFTKDGFRKVGWDQAGWDVGRAWRSVLEPHMLTSGSEPSGVVAFARHPEVSEQVWSSQVGYPGDGRYLEFHKKHGDNGLRYWRVTGSTAGLGDKDRYKPDEITGAVFSHAQHFCHVVRTILKRHHDETGRRGVVVAPFDAELFGHWWFEGPQWLGDVMLTLGGDPEVELCTASELLEANPVDKLAWLPEGSWGDGGDHRVWLNDNLRWTWEVMHRCEQRFGMMCMGVDWKGDPELRGLLEQAGRELLLLQASDWNFVITTGGAPDYGIKRFCGHVSRFDRLCDATWDRHQGRPLDASQLAAIAEARAFDDAFPELDLASWA